MKKYLCHTCILDADSHKCIGRITIGRIELKELQLTFVVRILILFFDLGISCWCCIMDMDAKYPTVREWCHYKMGE